MLKIGVQTGRLSGVVSCLSCVLSVMLCVVHNAFRMYSSVVDEQRDLRADPCPVSYIVVSYSIGFFKRIILLSSNYFIAHLSLPS